MSDNCAYERTDIYEMFAEAAEDMEVFIDSSGVWFDHEEGQTPVDDVVDDISEMYDAGVIETQYGAIKVIAAIAFWNRADIEAVDYEGEGGEERYHCE